MVLQKKNSSASKEYRVLLYVLVGVEYQKFIYFGQPQGMWDLSSVPRPGMEALAAVEALEKISMKQCYNRFKRSKAMSKKS